MYSFRGSCGPVDLAFTDRYGGVSAAPYDELNLALHGSDDPAAVETNLRRVLADFAPDAVAGPTMDQVHGADVAQVRRPDVAAEQHWLCCDGEVTDEPDLVLMVRVADCVPVLLADPEVGVIGVAHAGRKGLVAGVVTNTVARMRELGARRVTGWIGPSICGGCYEVPDQMQSEVAAAVPATRSTTTWGTPALDLGAGVRTQLEHLDVEVRAVGGCTRESADLYSYRRDGGAAGRFAGLIRARGLR